MLNAGLDAEEHRIIASFRQAGGAGGVRGDLVFVGRELLVPYCLWCRSRPYAWTSHHPATDSGWGIFHYEALLRPSRLRFASDMVATKWTRLAAHVGPNPGTALDHSVLDAFLRHCDSHRHPLVS